MIDIQKIIDDCTKTTTEYFDGRGNVTSSYFDKFKFAALIREAVVQELVAGSGESDGYRIGKDGEREDVYTADQLAGAVARERERCAKVCESMWGDGGDANDFAAAIRSGE